MKKLLSVVAILLMAVSLLPGKGQAGLRGAFDPITFGDDLIRGHLQPVLRPLPNAGAGTATSLKREVWIWMVTTSSVVGSENVGEIWQVRNIDQAALRGLPPTAVLRDPTGVVSFIDPAWSSDGNWLAYTQTDNFITQSSIFVQQFQRGSRLPVNTTTNASFNRTPLGSPILIADGTGGKHHRRAAWNDAGTQIAYDSDEFGPSIDLWTVDVTLDPVLHTGSTGARTRVTTIDNKAEFNCEYSPDGTKLAFVTNLFGTFTIQILNLVAEASGSPTPRFNGPAGTINGAEINPVLVTHENPSWASNGLSIYYDAGAAEDPANPQDIWKLDFADGAKCPIHIDLAGDVDPSVSQFTNVTRDGIPFNYFVFISQAANAGVHVWRAEFVQTCVAPLPMGVSISPQKIDLDQALTTVAEIRATLSFPPETQAAGYICLSTNSGGREGVRMRRSIIASPTMLGLRAKGDFSAFSGGALPVFSDNPAQETMEVHWNRRTIAARFVALGLVNQVVPLRVEAYSNLVGRTFAGFGYINLTTSSLLAGSLVRLLQNYPNPFNPQTKITFAVNKPGVVDVRVFNVRGELVRTIANQWFPQGEHTVAWDGKGDNGRHSSSGVYYIRANAQGGGTDVIKAVLAQ